MRTSNGTVLKCHSRMNAFGIKLLKNPSLFIYQSSQTYMNYLLLYTKPSKINYQTTCCTVEGRDYLEIGTCIHTVDNGLSLKTMGYPLYG